MGAIASILAGASTGMIGMVFQRLFDGVFQFLKAKQELALFQAKSQHELAMKDKDAALMDKEYAGRVKIAQTEGETAQNVSANTAFTQSLLTQTQRFSKTETLPDNKWGWFLHGLLVFVDLVRGLISPALTVYLCWVTTSIWFEMRTLASLEDLEATQIVTLMTLVIETVLYLTTTCVTWYFGTRNRQEPPTVRREDQAKAP